MRTQAKRLTMAMVAIAAMAFWPSASASGGEYAVFNECPDDGSGRDPRPGGPILNWWFRFHSAVSSASIKCKEISTCYFGSNSRGGQDSHKVTVHLENGLTGVNDVRQRLLGGDGTIASRAGGGRGRAYVVAIGHSCA
jgi:hypothetical protein